MTEVLQLLPHSWNPSSWVKNAGEDLCLAIEILGGNKGLNPKQLVFQPASRLHGGQFNMGITSCESHTLVLHRSLEKSSIHAVVEPSSPGSWLGWSVDAFYSMWRFGKWRDLVARARHALLLGSRTNEWSLRNYANRILQPLAHPFLPLTHPHEYHWWPRTGQNENGGTFLAHEGARATCKKMPYLDGRRLQVEAAGAHVSMRWLSEITRKAVALQQQWVETTLTEIHHYFSRPYFDVLSNLVVNGWYWKKRTGWRVSLS